MPTLLFIYGTLKRGQSRAFAMAGQRFLGEARTAPRYRMVRCRDAYPGLIDVENDRKTAGLAIEGELWQVDDDCLATLDYIEGVEVGLFTRRPVDVQDVSGPVYAYFFNGDVTDLPDCGTRW